MAILSKRSSALDPMRPSQVTWSGGDSHSKKQSQGRRSVTQEAQRMRHREVTSPQCPGLCSACWAHNRAPPARAPSPLLALQQGHPLSVHLTGWTWQMNRTPLSPVCQHPQVMGAVREGGQADGPEGQRGYIPHGAEPWGDCSLWGQAQILCGVPGQGLPLMPVLSLPQAVPPWHCAATASASTCSSAWQG